VLQHDAPFTTVTVNGAAVIDAGPPPFEHVILALHVEPERTLNTVELLRGAGAEVY
jgi:hypothetical protein